MAAAALGVAARRLHQAAAAQPPRLKKLALHPPKSVEVEFAHGSSFRLPAEFLRVYSPAADSKIRSVAGEKCKTIVASSELFAFNPCNADLSNRNLNHISLEDYHLSLGMILFDDLHKTGIFTWDYLHHLGSNKFSLMRNYIRTLRKHGLTRDPQRRK